MAWKISDLGKYLLLRTLDIRRFGLVINLHTCLPSIANLKAFKSLKPSFFGFCQHFPANLLLFLFIFPFAPQEFCFAHPFGSLKQDMLYTRRAWITVFSITSFPASLRNFVFQLLVVFFFSPFP